MTKNLPTILAIIPGSRYLGIAILCGQELRDWGVKVIKKRYFEERLEIEKRIFSDLVDRHKAEILAIKKLHPSRSSSNLNQLAAGIRALARLKGLRVCQYPLGQVEARICASDKVNKARLAERVCEIYPFLSRELRKEMGSRNPYHARTFEAVALGLTCLRDLESPNS